MFLFRRAVEVEETVVVKKKELESLKRELDLFKQAHKTETETRRSAEARLIYLRDKEMPFEIEKARFEKAKEMEKKLIESDILRVKAETALETYKAMDLKDDRKWTQRMLEKAIDGLSKEKLRVLNS